MKDLSSRRLRRLHVLTWEGTLSGYADGNKLARWLWTRIPCTTTWNAETRRLTIRSTYWEAMPLLDRLWRICRESHLEVFAS